MQDDIAAYFEKSLKMINSYGGGISSHPEIAIALSENAFHSGKQVIARRVLEHFLQRAPEKDQYYCRANILMGLLLDYEAQGSYGIESIRKRKIAVSQMMLSIDVATAPENALRYDFLVYNTSLSCWRVIRPFMRAGRAKHFCTEVSRISAALEKCDDQDMAWRVMFLSAAAYCWFDR